MALHIVAAIAVVIITGCIKLVANRADKENMRRELERLKHGNDDAKSFREEITLA